MERRGSGREDGPATRPAARTVVRERLGQAIHLGLMPLAVGLLSFAAFYPALHAEFVNYDDHHLFLDNPFYRGFGPENLAWMFTTTYMGHYQPLTWLSSALDYSISGLDPVSYHRNNLILHALNAVLLYFAARRLLAAGARVPPEAIGWQLHLAAAVAALLFAVHPLRVESVAWASERRDVLSTFFLLLALLAYLRAVPVGEPGLRSQTSYVGSIVALLLALLAKAWGMSFVLVVIVLDVYPLRRLPGRLAQWGTRPLRELWLQKLPYLMLGSAAALGAGWAQRGQLRIMATLEEWGLVERAVQASYGLTFYVWKTLWPTRLVACYELPYRLDPLEPRYLLSYLAVVLGIAAIILLRRRLPGLAAASVVYAIIVAPVLGFAQSGPQLVADKYSYVSCMGFALLGGAGCLWLWQRRRPLRLAGTAAATVIVAVLFVLAVRQTRVWNNSKSLWSHALAAGRPTAAAHVNLGVVMQLEDNRDEALAHYRRAVEIRPDAGNAWFSLAHQLERSGRRGDAEEAYLQAIRHMPDKHDGFINLGNLYGQQGRFDEASAAYRSAIAYLEPLRGTALFTPRPHLLLGITLHLRGNPHEARQWLERAAQYPQTRDEAQHYLRLLGARPRPP